MPRDVGELGPGDSLGIGLAALINGAETYSAFDIIEYATADRNLRVFNHLVELFKQRHPIPGPKELPYVRPLLDSWEFPDCFNGLSNMGKALGERRLKKLKSALTTLKPNANPGSPIRYICPWNDDRSLEPERLDLAFAQAVLEHVDDVPGTYKALANWLRPRGLFSQVIGFDCHGIVPDWNGHWTFNALAWRIIRGRKTYLINRRPLADHLRHLKEAGFEIIKVIREIDETGLAISEFAAPFRSMSLADSVTKSAYVLARKP